MPRFYPVSIELNGRRYTGGWELRQGGEICVGSAWGSLKEPIGRAKPENAAKRILSPGWTSAEPEGELVAMATVEIPDDWKPTNENIEALPDPLRVWIMMLETRCDPAGDLREMMQLRDQVAELQALIALDKAFRR
jgi:hypothetical protein